MGAMTFVTRLNYFALHFHCHDVNYFYFPSFKLLWANEILLEDELIIYFFTVLSSFTKGIFINKSKSLRMRPSE